MDCVVNGDSLGKMKNEKNWSDWHKIFFLSELISRNQTFCPEKYFWKICFLSEKQSMSNSNIVFWESGTHQRYIKIVSQQTIIVTPEKNIIKSWINTRQRKWQLTTSKWSVGFNRRSVVGFLLLSWRLKLIPGSKHFNSHIIRKPKSTGGAWLRVICSPPGGIGMPSGAAAASPGDRWRGWLAKKRGEGLPH